MSTNQQLRILLLGAMLFPVVLSPASSRHWKPTAIEVAEDYSMIRHAKSNTDFVNIKWWAQPTVSPGTPFASMLEKYIVISVVHFHINLPSGAMSFDEVETLDVRDSEEHPLTAVPENALLPVAVGVLSAIKTSFRQSLGRVGEGTKFFTFDPGTMRACEKGKLSALLAGETYTWDTPFPGCS